MRSNTEKKGGGLMLLHKDKKEIDLQQIKTKLKDMLVVKGTIKKYKTTIILVYL